MGIYKENSYKRKISKLLIDLEINDTFEIKEKISEIWGYHTSFIRRSFDVILCKLRKELKESKNITFKVNRGTLKRIT